MARRGAKRSTYKLPPQPTLARAKQHLSELADARCDEAKLTDAWFAGANLTRADLASAKLAGAQLFGADLTRAGLGGANLATAANLTQQQLNSARGDHRTKLPAGLHRQAHWSTGPAAPPAAER